MIPVIGIVIRDTHLGSRSDIPCYGVPKTYSDAIVAAGGAPVLLPPSPKIFSREFFQTLSGLMLIGGEDVDPIRYGETPHEELGVVVPWRDELEMTALNLADELKLPVLGICRGCQIINVHRGGTLFQHLEQHPDTKFTPEDLGESGIAEIDQDSRLHLVIGEDRIQTNSLHHQAVKDLGKDLKIVANSVATDLQPNVAVEAIEGTDPTRFYLGVQWHPEWMPESVSSKRLFKAFVGAIEDYASRR
jgi:putative glutamine amidotransferase